MQAPSWLQPMRFWIVGIALMAQVDVRAVSQCDATLAASFSVRAGTRTVSTWWRAKNADGSPATPTGWKAVLDGAVSAIAMKRSTTPDATACAQYSGPLAFPKGKHALAIQACAPDGLGGTACATSKPATVTAK